MKVLFVLLLATTCLANWQERFRSGENLLKLGKAQEAHRELLAALREADAARLAGPELGVILDALGRADFQLGNYRSAARYFERSLKIWNPRSKARATALCSVGEVYQAMGDYRRAEAVFRESLEVLPSAPQVWLVLGQVLLLRRDYGQSEASLNKALALFEELKSDQVAVVMSDLAALKYAQLNYPKALEILQRALLLLGPGQPRSRVLANLGLLNWKLGRKSEAETNFKLALVEMETAVGRQHPDVGRILDDYSEVLKKTGRTKEYREMKIRADGIRADFAIQTNSGRATIDWRDLK